MSKPINSLKPRSAKPTQSPFRAEALLNTNVKDKELNDTLKKVKLQVRHLVEQTQSNAKSKNGVSKEALAKAKALENLVSGVDQIIASLNQLRK